MLVPLKTLNVSSMQRSYCKSLDMVQPLNNLELSENCLGYGAVLSIGEAVCEKGIVMPVFISWFRNCCPITSGFIRKGASVLSLR